MRSHAHAQRRQRGERERRERKEASRHPWAAQRREDVAQRLVEGQVRPEREQRGDEGGDPEDDRQARAGAVRGPRAPAIAEDGDQPAQVDELLEAVEAPPAEEVDRVGRVRGDLGERPPSDAVVPSITVASASRPAPTAASAPPQAQSAGTSRKRTAAYAATNGSAPSARWSWPESGMETSAAAVERAPGMCAARRPGAAGPLEGPQRQRDEHRGPPEQVPAALDEPVRSDREREAAQRGGRDGKVELAEPEVDEEARSEGDGEDQQVPGDDRAEERIERPEREAVGPAAEHDLGLHERLEAVRIAPRLRPGPELVADEPEAIARLEMVARGRLAVARKAGRDELRAEVEQRRKRRDDRSQGEERRHEEAGAHAGMMHGAVTIGRYQRSARSRPRDDRRRVSRGGDGRRGSHPSRGGVSALAGRGRVGADHDRADDRRGDGPRREHGVDAAALVRAGVDRRAGRSPRRGRARHRRRGERTPGRARRRLCPQAPPALGRRARRPHRRARGPARPARRRAACLRALRAARARLRLAPGTRSREALVGQAWPHWPASLRPGF